MASSSEHIRAWGGPAILSFGFRPFFLGAALFAALAMAGWIAALTGHWTPSGPFDPISWHAHEFLFGYLGAVLAGFLLTAVPNWTGRLPIVGWRLGALAALWIAGRVVVSLPTGLPAAGIAVIDLSFLIVLSALIAREIIAGKNWRNLIVLAMVAVFITGNALFHWDAAQGGFAAAGAGLRLALGAGVMMVAVIGGRIVPSFTRNWLVKQTGGQGRQPSLPTPPMQRFDKVSLLVLLGALILWVVAPHAAASQIALIVAGALHLHRLARWQGVHTLSEPLVTILHLGYLFVPLGALAMGAAGLFPHALGAPAAQHLWMAGAIGVMTLAVMTRATLGHTGRALHAGAGTVAIYALIILSVLARFAAGLWPDAATALHHASAMGWIGAFSLFVLIYGALLLRPKPAA